VEEEEEEGGEEEMEVGMRFGEIVCVCVRG
jgi:hypothetical protein